MSGGVEIRVRGRVQGVGFRPTVWKLARELGVRGEVLNDGEGVLIRAGAAPDALATFLARLEAEPPPLARIAGLKIRAYDGELAAEFRIVASEPSATRTQIAPDAAICQACAAEIGDPGGRRYRYPFTTCTHCGPRLTIVTGVPYDRAATTLAGFPLCAPCAAEYADPADRRFHAESTACPACGPRARLVRLADGELVAAADPVAAAAELLRAGELVALKGLGGYHLACDATNAAAVGKLRAGKQRAAKPFALMARSLAVLRRYCAVSELEAAALTSPEAPIVLLAVTGATGAEQLPAQLAPGLATLGCMLPTTPLHQLLLAAFATPVVMTSGNLSDEPQAIDDADAARRLAGIATFALVHDRPIANRVDDSVVRVADNAVRVLRRARGYAPAPVRMPPGFEGAPPLLAYGGDLKAAFCLLTETGDAVLSQHQGDLEHPAALDDYAKHLALFTLLYGHAPVAVAVDAHPDFHSGALARPRGLPVTEVQHHHAHVAACLVEHGRPLAAPPVLGVVMDGLGLGGDGTLWGGEFLLADYRGCTRVGSLRPVAMLGGDRASREPWRNLYAHLVAADLPLPAALPELRGKPRALLDRMLQSGLGSPLASSCGRLFDAVAAAVGICFEQQAYEGEAATRLEAAVDPSDPAEHAYELASAGAQLDPRPLWRALLADLQRGTSTGAIAARFHRGLARGIAQLAAELARTHATDTIALSGGCFQNRILLEQTSAHLRAAGLTVLAHARVPTNDGGLALGQAAICAAELLSAAGAPRCV